LLGARFIKSLELQVTHRSNQITTGNSVSHNRISRHQKTSEERKKNLQTCLLILRVCLIRDVCASVITVTLLRQSDTVVRQGRMSCTAAYTGDTLPRRRY